MDFWKSFRWGSRKNKPQMLLKDYLLDDLSSCSSSGFKSLPRCPSFSSSLSTSVRFLINADLRSVVPPTKNGLSRSSSTALFRSAALKLVNAVKSPLRTTCFLPHGGGQAGKYLKNEAEEDITRWSSYCGEESIKIKWGRDVATSTPSYGGDSSGSNWDYGEFAAETSCILSWNGFVSEGKDAVLMGGEIVDGTDSEDHIGGKSIGPCSKEWLKDNEQSSPLSVLDCPFEDDEETVDAQSESSPVHVGTRKGNHRRDGRSRLALVQLEKIVASPELEEETTAHLDESISSPNKTACLIEEENTEAILERMLETVGEVDVPSYDSKSDVILQDFFREKLTEWEEYQYAGLFRGRDTFKDEAVRAAEDWSRGEPRDAYLGWEIEEGRTVYIKEMERGGEGDFERYEVCLEVDNVVWTLLVYEALIDIF